MIVRLLLFASYLLLVCASSPSDENRNLTWDYLKFAQLWPYSVCDVANLAQNDSCSIPKAVTSGWTIHGLWPSKFNQSMGPFFCVPKDHFDLQKVKPLVPELLHHWPNLIPSASVDSLWQHEWIKHGTCAEQLVAISGELNYFSQGLQLNERFSIRNALVQAGIEPSDEPKFKAADVATAMEKARGKKVEVHCLKSPQGKWYLVDVRICIDKQLQAFDCPHPQPDLAMEQSELLESLELPNVEICPPTALLYYPPPRPDHYHSDEQDEMHSHAYKYTDEFGDKWDSHYEEADHDEL